MAYIERTRRVPQEVQTDDAVAVALMLTSSSTGTDNQINLVQLHCLSLLPCYQALAFKHK